MGDDDFNLDDDLGLDEAGSDFGGGGGGGGDSDFAGSVDSEMEDVGGGGGGGETELDSFFEDLSSIDDVESPEPEAKPAPRAAAPAAAAAAPVAAAAVAAAPKGKGKLKMILLVLVVLVGLAAAAQWYMSNSQPEELAPEEPPAETPALQQTEVPAEEPVKVEDAKPLPPPPRAPVKPMAPPPPPEPVAEEPVTPGVRYLVQVGSCNFEKCQRDYADHLRRLGQPIYYRTTGEKYDFIELVTRDVFALRDAQNWVKMINDANQRAGVANLVPQSNGFRVSLGNFTSLDKAKDLKIYLENLFPKEGLKMNLEHVRKDYDTIKVFAGPFNSKGDADRALQKFREHRSFTGAFIVRF